MGSLATAIVKECFFDICLVFQMALANGPRLRRRTRWGILIWRETSYVIQWKTHEWFSKLPAAASRAKPMVGAIVQHT